MLWRFRLFKLSACRSLCVGGLDSVDRDEWNCEQLTDACNILGASWAGQQTVVTDAVEALRQHMHQEAADELVGIERHHAVSLGTFDAGILPLAGDAAVVERDQAAGGDGDPLGIAGEIAQSFLGPPEWAFAVDHPFAVAQ